MAGADAQEATIRRVLDAHCIWQLLGLQPTLHQPEAVLKKPVMQLYLLIHPDKCDHPDATLAFQHLSNLMDASQKPGHKKPTGSSKKRSRPSSPPKPPPPPPRGTPGDEWFSDADDTMPALVAALMAAALAISTRSGLGTRGTIATPMMATVDVMTESMARYPPKIGAVGSPTYLPPTHLLSALRNVRRG